MRREQECIRREQECIRREQECIRREHEEVPTRMRPCRDCAGARPQVQRGLAMAEGEKDKLSAAEREHKVRQRDQLLEDLE